MCFNETASILAFSIATITGIYKIKINDMNHAFFVFGVASMQLAEYFVHNAIKNKNKWLLKIASEFVYGILLFQPLFEAFTNYLYPKKEYLFKNPMKIFSVLFCLYIILFSIFVNRFKDNNKFYIIKQSNCKEGICRLNWTGLTNNPYLGISAFILYVLMHISFSDKLFIRSFRSLTVLLISLLYVLFVDVRSPRDIIGMWGSMWCFMAALLFPLEYVINKIF